MFEKVKSFNSVLKVNLQAKCMLPQYEMCEFASALEDYLPLIWKQGQLSSKIAK